MVMGHTTLPINSRIRIAFIFNHHFFLGGGEFSFFELITSLDRDVFEPVVIVPNEGEIRYRMNEIGITGYELPFPSLKDIAFIRPILAISKLVSFLKLKGIDIIHANGSRACFYSVLAGQRLNIPVLWHVRETIRDFFFYDGLLLLLSKEVVAVSGGVKEKRFSRFPHTLSRKLNVVYNGIDTARFIKIEGQRKTKRMELGLSENEILFGVVANFIALKGHDFFLKAMSKVKHHDPALDFKILFIGRPLDRLYCHKLRQLVSQLHFEEAVVFRDFTPEISSIYSALDVFVLPSEREGFSRSLLEAMSSELPVLATRLREIEEAVSDGENGFLVRHGDTDNMALAALTLCRNKELRKKMGMLNRKKVIEEFSLESHRRSILKTYERLLK